MGLVESLEALHIVETLYSPYIFPLQRSFDHGQHASNTFEATGAVPDCQAALRYPVSSLVYLEVQGSCDLAIAVVISHL